MNKFITKLVVVTLICVGLSFLISPYFDLGNYAWVVPLFYLALTIFSFWIVFKEKNGRQATFFTRLAGGMFLRMFFCVVFIIVYIKIDDTYSIPFIAYFMLLYFIYTSIEVYDLMKVMKTLDK